MMRSSPSHSKSARLLVQPTTAPRAAASSSPRARSSRALKPRPTPTMSGAASRLTWSPSLARRSTTFTLDLTSRVGVSTVPAPARRALGAERLGHHGEHLDRRRDLLARHGGAAEGVARGDQVAALGHQAVDVGDAAGAELLRQPRRRLLAAPRGADEHDGRAGDVGDLREAGGHCVGRPALERGVLAHVHGVGAGGGELARRGSGARPQGHGAHAEAEGRRQLLAAGDQFAGGLDLLAVDE